MRVLDLDPLLIYIQDAKTNDIGRGTELKYSDGTKEERKYQIIIRPNGQTAIEPEDCNSYNNNESTIRILDKSETTITPMVNGTPQPQKYRLRFKSEPNKECRVTILSGQGESYYFMLSNRDDLTLPSGTVKLTPGLAGKVVKITIPTNDGKTYYASRDIERLGVIVLGINGLRQDVLYSSDEAAYADGSGCVNSSCYIDPKNLKGFCDVLGGKYIEKQVPSPLNPDITLPAGSGECVTTGWGKKHIKLPKVTAIFPSITFASWASIYTGKMPSETGILGQEFFARDLITYNSGSNSYSWNPEIPGLNNMPPGIVPLDADGLAFKPERGSRFALENVAPIETSALGVFNASYNLQQKLEHSAPGALLKTQTLWSDINSIVSSKYRTGNNLTTKCEETGDECRTVSVGNQYATSMGINGKAQIGADRWVTPDSAWEAFGQYLESGLNQAKLMDKSVAGEALDFLNDYISDQNLITKRKRFPALFSIYLSGLDHQAHEEGMGKYQDFFLDMTDSLVESIVKKLKDKDEFDNKIFIITADHGHTAMPTNLKYKREQTILIGENEQTIIDYPPAEMSCKLKLDFQISPTYPNVGRNNRRSELANNNLHIWELAEVFSKLSEKMDYGLWSDTITGMQEDLGILTSAQIAKDYEDSDAVTSNLEMANVLAAFNGPMAHIYVKANSDWGADSPEYSNVENIAEVFRLFFQTNNWQEAEAQFGLVMEDYYEIRAQVPRLNSSLDTILIRQDGSYKIFNGKGVIAGDMAFADQYIDAINRITKMNNSKRSGDIVLIFKGSTEGDAINRFTSGVACKSWHGGLSPSDSYVPFIITYPAGNKEVLDTLKQNVCAASECGGNWVLKDFIIEIMNKQYSVQ